MKASFKQILWLNALLVLLYVLYNWVEYSTINAINPVRVHSIFPLVVLYGNNVVQEFVDVNFNLVRFILSVFMNLYFIRNLQKYKSSEEIADPKRQNTLST